MAGVSPAGEVKKGRKKMRVYDVMSRLFVINDNPINIIIYNGYGRNREEKYNTTIVTKNYKKWHNLPKDILELKVDDCFIYILDNCIELSIYIP